MQPEAGWSCLTSGGTLNGMSASERHRQPGEPGMLGRSSGGAAGRMDPVPGVCAGAGCDVTVGIKRRAVSAAAEPLAGCSAPARRTASALGRAAPCRASSIATLGVAPACGETPVKGWMNRLADFFRVRVVLHQEVNMQLCFPRQFLQEQLWPCSCQQRRASISGCSVRTGRSGPASPQKSRESGKWPVGGGSWGRSGGSGRIASPEAT